MIASGRAKGTGTGVRLYPRPDLRYSVDLDILVPAARFAEVLDRLDHDGFELVDRNWPLIERLVPGQLRVRSPRGVLVDLHWAILNNPSLRATFRLPTVDLLVRRAWLEAPAIPVLDHVDQLVHLGLHGALSGGTRLLWLLDADRAARLVADWVPVIEAAHRSGAHVALAVVLQRARTLWATPVPQEALTSLAGGRLWLAATRAIDSRVDAGRTPDRPSMARAWARSARPSGLLTLGEFAAHGLAWLRSGRPTTRVDGPIIDSANPQSALHPVPNDAARSRYFAAVTSWR